MPLTADPLPTPCRSALCLPHRLPHDAGSAYGCRAPSRLCRKVEPSCCCAAADGRAIMAGCRDGYGPCRVQCRHRNINAGLVLHTVPLLYQQVPVCTRGAHNTMRTTFSLSGVNCALVLPCAVLRAGRTHYDAQSERPIRRKLCASPFEKEKNAKLDTSSVKPSCKASPR